MEINFSTDTNLLTAVGQAAWLSLKEDKSWDHWRAIGYAIDAARRDIRHALGNPNSDSKKVKDAMGLWLREKGWGALNHPDAIWRRFKVTLEDGLPPAPKTTAKDIQIEGLQHLLEERNERIIELESGQTKGNDAQWEGIGELRAARERIAELEARIAEETRLREAAEAALADVRSEASKPIQSDRPDTPLS